MAFLKEHDASNVGEKLFGANKSQKNVHLVLVPIVMKKILSVYLMCSIIYVSFEKFCCLNGVNLLVENTWICLEKENPC